MKMLILLGESDAFLHDGLAKNIIVHVTLDSGKKMQFPYVASKTLCELYSDVANISDEQIVAPVIFSPTVSPIVVSPQKDAGGTFPASPPCEDGEIKKEDLVKCVKVEDRGKGATVDIVVGGIYRVLKVNKSGVAIDGKIVSIVNFYDVIDDESPTPRRIFVLPHEVIFYKKRKPSVPKIQGKIEEIFDCPTLECGVKMVCYKQDDGKFKGECEKCHNVSEFLGVRNAQPSNSTPQDVQSAAVGGNL